MVKFTQLKVYLKNEMVFSQDIKIHSDSINADEKVIIFDTIELINGEKISDQSLIVSIISSIENESSFEFTTNTGFTFVIN